MAKAPTRRPAAKKTPSRGNGPKGSRSSLGIGLLTAGGTLGLFLIAALIALWAVYWGPGPKAANGDYTIVTVQSGTGVPAIAATLKREGVIRSTDLFKAAMSLSGADRKVRAGEYEVPSGASLSKIVHMLANGKGVRHFVTLPEGRSSAQAVEILMRNPVLVGEITEVPEEGSLWPETYEVTRGETRQAVIARMQRMAKQKMDALWPTRGPNSVARTPHEALVLASVVEKETGIASERPVVAAVFSNRLRVGMRLESDPTIIYGITKGRPLGRGLKLSEIRANTPWNTYVINGLPPTPIANPGEASIKAVLNPPKSDYLFFVADGTGGHVFASTYQEHLLNVARWRDVERRRAAIERGETLEDTLPSSVEDSGPRILTPDQIPVGAQVIRVPEDAR
ncbi:endolytic transglycosylase MltG [Brevundimonas pishanensis]|uniref:endolytic transglycosylase MltG n=1 Tax=Brevundimonas pishanensis TaxID=2896315 RepID=UPI001FA7B981|nr:endolytic transglycosylase MltG [Brevundimonas pishanensis]